MKTYTGTRTNDGRSVVTVKEGAMPSQPLKPRTDLRNHSPDGLSWGYGGSGPAQLALALCADALGDDQMALSAYQAFKDRYVARWAEGSFTITDETIIGAVEALLP